MFVAGGCFKKAVIGGFTWWQGAGSTGCHWSTHPVSGDHLGELVEADVPDWGMNEGLLDNSACVSDAILLLNSSWILALTEFWRAMVSVSVLTIADSSHY